MPYEWQKQHAIDVALEYYDKVTRELNANVHVSVGGLDSITLLLFLIGLTDCLRTIPKSGIFGCTRRVGARYLIISVLSGILRIKRVSRGCKYEMV